MSWDVVARKEINDAIRSRVLLALSVALVLLALLVTGIYALIPIVFGGDASEQTLQGLLGFLRPAAFFVPVLGAVLGYKAIVGERTSGSLNLMLSLPHTRDDVVVGKLAGRAVVLAIPLILAFLAGFVLVALRFDSFSVVTYATFLALLLLIGIAYLSIAVAVSASTESTLISAVSVLGMYFLLRFVWTRSMVGLYMLSKRVTTGEWVLPTGNYPEWVSFLAMLSPHSAYDMAMYGFVVDVPAAFQPWYMDPWFANEWTGILLLLLWIVLPVTFGVVRFRSVDL